MNERAAEKLAGRAGQRKAITLSPQQLVRAELLQPDKRLPLVIRPAVKGQSVFRLR